MRGRLLGLLLCLLLLLSLLMLRSLDLRYLLSEAKMLCQVQASAPAASTSSTPPC